ncbi:MAG: carboxypeptidase regulatory-like domain-containing protein, partial [Planctomycetes bacterium]|nr:carboxypeptidase regulatory-like domain-containing protein [Planctomycetota bacterium]
MVRPLAILAVLLAVAALVWFGSGLIAPGDVRPSDLTDRGTSPVPAAPEVAMDSAAAPAPDAGTEPGAATREVVSTGGASASLAVALRWSNDQSPAVGIPVQVRLGWDDTRIRIPSAVSDAAGNCLFEGLTPGEVRAAYGHGERRYTEPIALVAGGHAEVTIEVEVGLSIRGRVVDAASRPVPDATIVVAGWSGGRSDAAGRSGSDGSFALRGLPLNCHVGARKAGFVPSSMRSLTTSGEAEIELTIVLESGGGSLSGRVFGPDGEPVAGAQVRCGDTAQNNHTLPDGGSAMAPQPVTTRTDSDGRFAFEGLVPGSNPLGVRAEELAPHYEVVEIATGNPTEITVHLLRGATLRGVTKNEQGLPIAGAWISVHDREHRESRSARTLADGSYRLGGLRSGRLEAMARHTDHGVTNVEFEFAAGREQRWDPVLSAGLQQRGRVLDGNGDPVEGAIVEAQLDPWVRGNDWYGYVVTGADGRFVLKNCVPDHAIRLTVRTESVFPVAKMRGV